MSLEQFELDLAEKLDSIANRGGITDLEIERGELIASFENENEDADSQTDYKNSLKNDY